MTALAKLEDFAKTPGVHIETFLGTEYLSDCDPAAPAGPSALNRITQSRMICNPTSPIRAALLRLAPS
jgi:hypothetical protein